MKKMSNKAKYFGTIALLVAPLIFLMSFSLPSIVKSPDLVVRAAIDIGSGATKLKVAKINLKTKKIEKVLVNESFPVQYAEELEKAKNNSFNEELMQEGIDALKKSKEIAAKYGAEKVVAVATASFRKANNADSFTRKIKDETDIDVYIVDQDLEGALGFQATAAQFDAKPEELIVWDIGGGSAQFTALDEKGELIVHRSLDASIPFKNRVIQEIKKGNPGKITTPNPLNITEILKAEKAALEISKKVDAFFKEKIANPSTQVVGIGNIFTYRIHPLVDKKSKFTQEELTKKVYGLDGLTDEDLGKGDYTNVAVTNPILVLGHMKTLGIEKMRVMDINNADGALLYAPFWEQKEASAEA